MKQSSTVQSSIEDQVKLPAPVALQVVLQGMKIRFGRSLVTIMGVVLGIAFLMSILTSQLLKSGVSIEQAARLELQRMNNFLKADMGPPTGKAIGVLQAGPLSAMEQRFIRSLVGQQAATFNWCTLEGSNSDDDAKVTLLAGEALNRSELEPLLANSDMVLLLGEDKLPAKTWQERLGGSGLGRIATTQKVDNSELPESLKVTRLSRELRPEELKKLEAEKRTARFRNIWIIIISLLVTVIGISNAMLMSVTERFREIGTMKCLGALSAFVRQIFLFESCLIGAVGGLLGSLVGSLFSILIYAFTYGFGVVMASVTSTIGNLFLYLLLAFTAGVVLSMIAAIYPANVASRMVPADALRSNI
ncbi:MAG: ABC transporter permease [Verrucomicrobia bacterium]|jgi:hypothetical protein|nr:ABC transporter permease [Verrucomicrobiota bacterium]